MESGHTVKAVLVSLRLFTSLAKAQAPQAQKFLVVGVDTKAPVPESCVAQVKILKTQLDTIGEPNKALDESAALTAGS